MDERIEMQELYCHNCNKYVQFPIDLSMNGNHVLRCPNCDHEHCRVVRDGIISGDRWDQRNGGTFQVRASVMTFSNTSSSSSTGWSFYGRSDSSSSVNIYTNGSGGYVSATTA